MQSNPVDDGLEKQSGSIQSLASLKISAYSRGVLRNLEELGAGPGWRLGRLPEVLPPKNL